MSAIFAPAPADQTRVRCVDLLAQLRFLLANPSTDANQKFRASYDELASFPQEHACAELLECLFVISNYFYLAAQPSLGLPSATRGVEIARRLEDPRLLRRALSIFGVMCMETGNLPGSTEALSEALEIARVLRDPALEAPIWNNLGLALQGAAQYGDALQCFERAAARASA
jgi:tetratricopeptide (TPR) repeat protein